MRQGTLAGSGAWVGAQFPFITANLNFSADSSLRGLADATIGGTASNAFAGKEASTIMGKIAPYTVVTEGGEKIGIVGATTYDLLIKSSPNGTVPKDDGNPSTDDLQEVAAYIQAAVNALTSFGVNKIMLVDQLDTLERNQLLAPMVYGIDVMIAGGGHERMGDSTDTAAGFNGHDANFVATYPILTVGSDSKSLPGVVLASLKNGGGIRASIGSIGEDGEKLPPAASSVKPAGAISQLDVENALRFDNKLMVSIQILRICWIS